jgi:hypothetical protein
MTLRNIGCDRQVQCFDQIAVLCAALGISRRQLVPNRRLATVSLTLLPRYQVTHSLMTTIKLSVKKSSLMNLYSAIQKFYN